MVKLYGIHAVSVTAKGFVPFESTSSKFQLTFSWTDWDGDERRRRWYKSYLSCQAERLNVWMPIYSMKPRSYNLGGSYLADIRWGRGGQRSGPAIWKGCEWPGMTITLSLKIKSNQISTKGGNVAYACKEVHNKRSDTASSERYMYIWILVPWRQMDLSLRPTLPTAPNPVVRHIYL